VRNASPCTPTRKEHKGQYNDEVHGANLGLFVFILDNTIMISIAHVLIGGAVGTAVGVATGSTLAALAAGVVTHLVADSIPHFDSPPGGELDKEGQLKWTPGVYAYAFTDSIVAWLIVLFFWYSFYSFPIITPFIAGAFGGYLPDLIDNVPFWKNIFRPWPGFKQFHAFHEAIHENWEKRFPMPPYIWLGILTQVVAVTLSLWYLLKG
jgi:hypothetical protein